MEALTKVCDLDTARAAQARDEGTSKNSSCR